MADSDLNAPTAPAKPPAPEDGRCVLCGQPAHLTFHHLVPKRVHAKPWARQRYALEVLRTRGIWVCRSCHSFLHRQFDERTLGERLDSLEALRAEPSIARHIDWASRQRRTLG